MPVAQRKSQVSVSIRNGDEPERLRQIYEKASQIFHKKGFDATSMDDLARVLQMTKAGLYYYIGSKQDLLFEIMNYAMVWLEREVVEPARDIENPLDRIRFVILTHGRELIEGPHAVSILSDEVAALKPKHRKEILARKREYLELVRDALNELAAAGVLRPLDTTVASYNFFGTLMWLPRWCNPKGRLSTDEVLNEISSLLLGGLVKS